MTTMDHFNEFDVSELDSVPGLRLELSLDEAEALRVRLLMAAADGSTSLDDPLVNGVLARLGRAVEAHQATVNVRRELEQAGLDLAHLSNEQVRELGRRVSDAAMPALRG